MKTWNVCPNDLATLLDVVINSIHNIIYVFLNLIWCPPADFPGSYSLRLVKVLEWRSPVMQLKGGWTTLDRIQIISLGLHKSKKQKKKVSHVYVSIYEHSFFYTHYSVCGITWYPISLYTVSREKIYQWKKYCRVDLGKNSF